MPSLPQISMIFWIMLKGVFWSERISSGLAGILAPVRAFSFMYSQPPGCAIMKAAWSAR